MRRLMILTRPIRLFTAVALAGALAFSSTVALAAEQPNLGTAADYAVMATSTITNTGATTITGGLALDPGTAVTGDPVVIGSYDVDNAAAELAHEHLIIAYDEAFNALTTSNLTGSDLGTVGVLTPGVYTFDSSAQLTGNLTLDGGGATNPVFIFQMGSTLTTASDASVSLQNGAGACAIFWQVGSSATLGTGTDFQGTIMAAESITMNTGATIGVGGLNYGGRALAMNGAVTLDTNTIIAPTSSCVFAAAATPTPVPTATPVAATPTPVPAATPTVTPSAPASTAPSAPTSVATVPVVDVPEISLFPGLPDTRLPRAAETRSNAVALLGLASLAIFGGLSMAVASSRRRS